MSQLKLELELLKYWKENGVVWLYQYKHRVKEYLGDNRHNFELFLDLTCGRMFTDIKDIANYSDLTGEEAKIHIDELIEKRENALGTTN